METCKRCETTDLVKNGIIRGKQRYKCSVCKLNFVEGDERGSDFAMLRKALALVFYRMTNTPYEAMGKLFGVSKAMVQKWINEFDAKVPKNQLTEIHTGMKYSEIESFIKSNKDYLGGNKQWIVAKGEVLPGYSAILILRRSDNDV